MSATLTFGEASVFEAVRAFLLQILPTPTTGLEVIRAQVNRVPEPASPDFAVMTQILRTRLATNTDTYRDGFFSTPPVPGTASRLTPTQFDIQLDVHGPASGDNIQLISTLWRDEYGVRFFDEFPGIDAEPLFSSEPRQMSFINSESQYETRWTIDLSLQLNEVVVTPQEFADQLNVGLISVDVVYPP